MTASDISHIYYTSCEQQARFLRHSISYRHTYQPVSKVISTSAFPHRCLLFEEMAAICGTFWQTLMCISHCISAFLHAKVQLQIHCSSSVIAWRKTLSIITQSANHPISSIWHARASSPLKNNNNNSNKTIIF